MIIDRELKAALIIKLDFGRFSAGRDDHKPVPFRFAGTGI